MKQSTSFAQVATNQFDYLSSALCANTPPCKKHSSSRKFLTLSISLRLLLVMFLTLTVSAEVWGADVTVKWTASSGALGSGIGSGTIKTGSFSWNYTRTLISGLSYTGWSSNCIQLGKNGGVENIIFTTSAIPGTIKKVSIECASYQGKHNVAITVGGKSYLSSTATSSWTTVSAKSGSGTSSGTIQISLTGGTRALYIKSISVTYEEAAATIPVTGVSLNKSTLTLTEGSSETLTATILPNDATDKTVTWTTNNSSVATVSSGKVTAIAKGSAIITVTTNDGKKTATCNVTVNPKPKYTVTWDVNGDQSVTTQVTEGSKPTFPATPSSCDATSTTFYGWATATWDGKIDDINGKTIYTSANDMPVVNGAVTYYAVFAKKETSGSGTAGWSKVTSTSDLEVGATYAISSAETAGNYLSTYTGANNFPNSTTTICKLVLGGSADAWTFKINDASSYNNYYLTATSTTSSNYLKATSTIDNYCKFSISFANTGNAVITCTGKQSRNILRYNSTNNPPIFACYSSGQSAVYLQKYSTGSTTTYSDYITTCAAGDPCASLQAPNVTATATANSITLSWEAVDGATSYNVYNYTTEEAEEVNVLTYTFNGLDPETEYEWGVESAKGECSKETRGTTTTKKACTDAVTIGKGTETNGTFTLSTTGQQSTCDGSVTVTLSNIQPATGYQFSEITQLGINTGVAIDNTAKTVTYAKNTTGISTINVTFTPAVYTITYKDQGNVAFSGTHEEGSPTTHTYNTATTLKSASKNHYTFDGWYKESDCSGTKVTILEATEYTDNITLYAKWTAKTYTITLDAGNGECDTESVTTTNASGVTLPTASHSCTDWTFAGWWTEEVSSTNTSPGTLMKVGETYKPTSDITLYAVYSAQEAGDAFTKYAKVTTAPDDWSGKYLLSTGTYTATGAYDASGANGHLVRTTYTPGTDENAEWEFTLAKVDVDGNTVGYSILFPDGSFYLGYASSTNFQRSIDDPSENEAYLWTPSISGITNVGDNTRIIKDGGSDFRPYVNDNPIVYLYKRVGGGSTTIYNSNPTCLVPVWEGATIDNTNLTVNCGERSPMTGANGAAKITFSAEKIYNFTKDITIEATTGFLVSTSQSVDANYQSSVSLSPLVGTTNANTFYDKFVYVRAEAPAMLEEDLSGTITIKNNKGETLQTFSVTADVTCAQYTLTLVDRGVSTEQPTKYYAGETIDEAPADPEGVCTDPIHYVFDGWAETTVTNGSTGYTPVSFPYTVTGNTKFYAVYRYLEGGGNGDYNLVTEKLADWSGDYLIAYSDQIFANGKIGGKEGIGAAGEKVDLSSYLNNNTIPAVEGDKYKVSLEAITDGYLLKTQDGKYNYQSSNTNGLEATTNKNTATTYKLSVNYVSSEEINLCLSGNALGAIFRYNTDQQGYFRFYKNGGQQPVYLYKKADGTTYYTTSPVCGPHLAITEGKDIYVTGGNAGGTRDLVIAQTKVSYKATRLEKDKSTGNLPSIKALPSNIVFDNTKTKAVAVTFDEDSVRTLQSDGTYTITGNITIAYQPVAANVTDDIQVTLNANYNPSADVSQASFTVHARSLPSEFVIVAKSGDKWYALNGDMNNGSSANPANGQVTLNDDANPTKATYAPCNTIYTFDGLPNTGDRTYVRFQGTDGAWLWASSGNNVGIQNNVLKTTPEGSNKAYNWKLYTEDNITYRFGNANSSRQLTLNGEKFGMYASGVQDIRILPYEAKCLYNYAPSNLKVSVLKGTYVTLTWDAVAGATKYQYSTNGTTWTDAGTDPTVTINGLTGAKEYTYYIRAYHEDAGVSQECIDYAEITFTTADCDDVPTDITYSADMNSITVSWTAAAPTATIKLFMNEDGTGGGGTYPGATSPYTISGGLNKNTTYYIQILSDGTCASPIIPVKTEDVEVDIVEWKPDGIIVDINTNEKIGVTLENEVSYGSGLGTEATELFFSKYYEASYNVKLVAIYNGTKNIIDLTDYTIQYGKTSWETNYITLKDFGATKGQIQPGEEIILYSYTENNADDKKILDCVHDAYPDGNWVRVTSTNNDGKGTLSFGGDKTIILCKTEYDDEAGEYYDNIIDVIGALIEDPNVGILPTQKNTEIPSWGDKEGWVCETGLSIADDSQIGISTNRCLLIRNNTVTSGDNAVTQNIDDFVTLCSEWKGAHVPDNDIDNGVQASCDNFAYVGTFDYSDYYTKYVPMGTSTTFDENARNADGTVTIPITDLYKHACSNIRVKLTKENGEVLSDREYKVPIMITTTQGTDGQAFLDLQQNLATVEVDGEGNVINTYPLSLNEVREICKTCDVVVRDNATLTKVTDGTTNDHPQVHDVIVYEGASIVIPDGTDHNYTINSLALRRKGDEVASAQVQGTGKFVLPADAPVTLSMRIDANNWHWFTLPYDCDIADVTWSDGTEAKYNTDWFLMYYDGESRSNQKSNYESHWKVYNGTTIEAGKGYIIGITGDLTHPDYTFELRFPMAQEVLAAEQTDKTVAVNAWGVKKDIRPNHKGWNLVGNPYMDYYQPNTNGFAGLPLIKYLSTNSAGEWLYDDSGTVPFLVIPQDGGWSEYKQELASDVDMQPFTAYFVQVGDPNNEEHSDGVGLNARFEADKRGRSSLIRRAPSEVDELEEPAIVAVSLTNAKGESDKTTLLIADRFTNEYEMNADFFKWFGDYYTYYTKPVLYTLGADKESRAFNALNEELTAQPVALGMYAAQAGNYTFSLHQRSNLTGVAEVWLHDASNNTHTNLLQDDYTFSTSKTNGSGRFSLSVKMIQKLPTDVENIKQGNVWATTQDNEIVINGLAKDMQLWIYDATGKLVHADRTTNYQHSYSVPQTGAYFVRVHDKNDAQTIKVVVE